ncbi:hypothetical protein JCM3770_005257 [Rhodotorula araucariae]
MPADPAPSIAARRLLAPTLNTQGWSTRSPPTQASIKDLIAQRTHHSPLPPPSPALSESGFSVFDTPATHGSTTFHFEAHHRFAFTDEPFTPDLAANVAAVLDDEYNDERASHEDRVVLQTVQDHEDHKPCPYAGTPPFSPSQTSFATDRLSVQSTTTTDFSTCSPSPSPSIGSVRMATVTKVPMRPFAHPRESLSAYSILSESVEDATEDAEETIWDARALARNSFVDRLPHDLEANLHAGQPLVPEEEPASIDAASYEAVQPAVSAKEPNSLPKSGSEQSQLSGQSRKDSLETADGQISMDPAVKPEEDAMRRMKSILGPRTRIISEAPWDTDGEVLPVKPSSGRRSFDVLSMASSMANRAPTAKASKDATAWGHTVRSHSFSTLLSSHLLSDEDARECERGLAGLGIGLDTSPVLSPSESKRSFGSLRPSPSMSLGEPLPDVAAASLAAYAEHAMARPTSTRAGSAGRVPKVGRCPAPIYFDKASSSPLASPTGPSPPMSAPPSITLFAHASMLSAFESKASLPPSSGSPSSTSPSPSTPGALNALGTSPASSSTGSYFSATPGALPTTSMKAGGFGGHRLISLEEARQREIDRSAAAQRKAASTPPLETATDRGASRFRDPRTRDSTAESLSSRRGMQLPSAIVTSSPTGAPTSKALKPKKSGFLKRMMGGGSDKNHDRPQMPDPYRPSMSSSASILTLSSVTPASSLGKSSGLRIAESLSSSASTGRVAFAPALPTAANDRIGKRVPAPALSLRPVSMAFSAGLPADFLANSPSSGKNHSATSPSSIAHSSSLRSGGGQGLSPPSHSASLPILAGPLVSPQASSFKSSVSPNAPSSLFDNILPPSAGLATPSTPGVLAALPPSASGDAGPATPERFAALQDEYASAKRAWVRMQYELESQVQALEGEVQRLRAAGEQRCNRCGAGGAQGEEAKVLQRPRAKVTNGAGTRFGSNIA